MPRHEHRKGIQVWYGEKELCLSYSTYQCRFPVMGAFFTFWVRNCPKTGVLLMHGTIRGTKKRRFCGAENFILQTQFGPALFLPNGNMIPIRVGHRYVVTRLVQRPSQKRFPTVGERSKNRIRPLMRGVQSVIKPSRRRLTQISASG